MGVTLSHCSALWVVRTLRCAGHNLLEMSTENLKRPSTWEGKRWSLKEFDSEEWKWQKPAKERPLQILVPSHADRVRMETVENHICTRSLPASSIIWLDEASSVVSPELLFYQMSGLLPLHLLVMLGHELCGNYSVTANSTRATSVVMNIPQATSVRQIEKYLDSLCGPRSAKPARMALRYVANNALSVPEAQLSTACALPWELHGYGLGPVVLNERICIGSEEREGSGRRNRYPDLLFSFAPIGINYEGEGHLDLGGLVEAARLAELAEGEEIAESRSALAEKVEMIRAKYVDDICRDRELASRGYLVLRATKEDLVDGSALDELMRQVLESAQSLSGFDSTKHIKMLEDTDRRRDRHDLIRSLLQNGTSLAIDQGNPKQKAER